MLTMCRSLPFTPESPLVLRDRYNAALLEVFDQESLNLGLQMHASLRRTNTFDWPCGLRAVVGRVQPVRGPCTLRMLTMLTPGSLIEANVCRLLASGYVERAVTLVGEHLADLASVELTSLTWLEAWGEWWNWKVEGV